MLDAVRRRLGREAAPADGSIVVDTSSPDWPEKVGRRASDRIRLVVPEPGGMALVFDGERDGATSERLSEAWWYLELRDRLASALLEGLPPGSQAADAPDALGEDGRDLLDPERRLDAETRLLRLGFRRLVLVREALLEGGGVVLRATIRDVETGEERLLELQITPSTAEIPEGAVLLDDWAPDEADAPEPLAPVTAAEPGPVVGPAPSSRGVEPDLAVRGDLLLGLTNGPDGSAARLQLGEDAGVGGRPLLLIGTAFLHAGGPLGRKGARLRVDAEGRLLHQPDAIGFRVSSGLDPQDDPIAWTTADAQLSLASGWGARLGGAQLEVTLGPVFGFTGSTRQVRQNLAEDYAVSVCTAGAVSGGGLLRVRAGAEAGGVLLGGEVAARVLANVADLWDWDTCGVFDPESRAAYRASYDFLRSGANGRLRAVGRLAAPVTSRVSFGLQLGVEASFARDIVPVDDADPLDLIGLSSEEEELGLVWRGTATSWVPVVLVGVTWQL